MDKRDIVMSSTELATHQNMASSHTPTLLPSPGPELRALFPTSSETIASLLGLVLWHVQTVVSNATSDASMVMDQIEPALRSFINSTIYSILLITSTSSGSSDPNLVSKVSAIEASLTALTKSVGECLKGPFPAARTSSPEPPITLTSGGPLSHEQSQHQDNLKPSKGKEQESLRALETDSEYESIVTEYLENERRKQGGGTGTGNNPFILDDLKEDETPGSLQKSSIPQAAASHSEAEAAEDESETAQTGRLPIDPRVDHPAVNARGLRVRKTRVVNLPVKSCECGRPISQEEINAGILVIKCKFPGCETVWVSPFYRYLHLIVIMSSGQ